jgi:HAD superfamily hydrolase (TIGR01662 family)
LLDRDGTIIVDSGYVGSVDRVAFIDGAPQAIAQFNQAGVPVAVLTNQAGVARGFYGINDVHSVHDYISEKLAEYRAHVDLFLPPGRRCSRFCPRQ